MEKNKQIQVEVAFATADEQIIIPVDIPVGATAQDAINKSNILKKFKQIDLATTRIGIFSKICKLEDLLREGDRVEIYRPLIADPKQMRKQRAAKQKNKLKS
ncbi:MAG: RnfH family protein [Thiomargarita sp.]|nr:RnfH family protein [Thiomargarita sp.]